MQGHVSAAEIHRQLVEVYGEEVMSRQSVAKWYAQFKAYESGQRTMRETNDRQQQALPRTMRVLKQQFWKTEE
jgi:hypothetical protein